MSQIKVYGLKDNLNNIKGKLSEVIHSCVVDAFQMPEDKRFHRFFPLDREDFYFQKGRTERYTIIEISIFEGRTIEAKKKLIGLLFERIQKELNIMPNDIEITIFETPNHNWGIRGLPGDELSLNYNIKV
ncbi:tautomerase family protein [Clostridium sp. WILCCON 0269]|uniref:Tautomerase family protein n=1 Tax=Candidatus Clostridium eludens TaxID=3381663 RepID=A0ABW8SS01_9CLOT